MHHGHVTRKILSNNTYQNYEKKKHTIGHNMDIYFDKNQHLLIFEYNHY